MLLEDVVDNIVSQSSLLRLSLHEIEIHPEWNITIYKIAIGIQFIAQISSMCSFREDIWIVWLKPFKLFETAYHIWCYSTFRTVHFHKK